MVRWRHTSKSIDSRFLIGAVLILSAGCAPPPKLDHPGFDDPSIAVLLLDENGSLVADRNGSLATGHAFLAGDFLRVPTTIAGIERGELNPAGSFACRDLADSNSSPISFRDAFRDPCRSVFREIQRKIPWADYEPGLLALGLGAVSAFGGPGEDPGSVPKKIAGEGSWDLWGNRLITASPAQMALALHRTFAGENMTPATRDAWAGITAGNHDLHGVTGRFDEEMLGYRWIALRGSRDGRGGTYLLFVFALSPTGQAVAPEIERYAAEWFGAALPIW